MAKLSVVEPTASFCVVVKSTAKLPCRSFRRKNLNRPGGGGFGPGARGMMGAPGAKAKDARKTLQTLLRYLQPYRVKIIIVIVFAALSSIFSIVGPKVLGKVTTKLAEGLIASYLQAGLYM